MSAGTDLERPCLGCMFFGTKVAPEQSFAVLDHYVEVGGRLLDTADNYAFWVEGGTGDESEELLGRWLAERSNRDVAAGNLTLPRRRGAHALAADGSGNARYVAIQQRAGYLTPCPDADLGVQICWDQAPAAYAGEQQMPVFGYSVPLGGSYRPGRAVRSAAERHGVEPAQVVLAWVAGRRIVPVHGVSTVSRIDQALAAADLVLDADSVAELDAARHAGPARAEPVLG